MATITAAAGGGNWNVGSTWVGGVVPLTTDDVVLDGTSGQVTISATAQCKDINFSGYTNTITFNANLTITGNLTRDTSVFTYAGTGGIIIAGTSTQNITTSGSSWDIPITIGGASPNLSIVDAFTINATLTLSSTTSPIIARFNVLDTTENIEAIGNIVVSGNGTYTGSANIVVSGSNNQTLTASGSHQIRNNLTINKTGGVLTLSGTLNYNTGTFTYIAGTVNTGTSTLNIGAATTFNTNGSTISGATTTSSTGINWFNVTLSSTLNLTSNFTSVGTFTANAGAITRAASESLYLGGSLTMSSTLVSSSTPIIMNGTGTWSGSGLLYASLTFNTTGTITISGTVSIATSTFAITLTYIVNTGSVVTSGSTLTISRGGTSTSLTLNTGTLSWNNIQINGYNQIGGVTFVTLASDLNMSGNLLTTTSGLNGLNCQINGLFNVNVGGNLNINAATTGASTIVLNGIGNQTWSSTGYYLSNNLTINKPSGTLTIGTNVYYQTGTFTYTSGTNTGAGTIIFGTNTTLNLGANKLNVNAALVGNITLTSDATFTNLTTQTTSVVLSGAFTVNVEGNLAINVATSGASTPIVLNGTGAQSWTHGSAVYLSNNLTINKSSGTLTIGSVSLPNVYYVTGTLTYTTGTVDAATNSSTLNIGGTCSLNTNGINWYRITITPSATTTITLSSDINITNRLTYSYGTISHAGSGLINLTGDLQISSAANFSFNTSLNFNGRNINVINLEISINNGLTSTTITNSGGIIYVSGNYTLSNGTNNVGGISCSPIVFNGTGTWSHTTTSTQRAFHGGSITINTTGTLTFGSFINYGIATGTLTYIQGNVNQTTNNNFFSIYGNCSLNTSNLILNNVLYWAYGQLTLLSDLQTITLTIGGANTINGSYDIYCATLNINNSTSGAGGAVTYARNFYCSGDCNVSVLKSTATAYVGGNCSYANSGAALGFANLYMIGNGTLTALATGNFTFPSNLYINTSGKIKLVGTFSFGNDTNTAAIINLIRGSVDASKATIILPTFQTHTLTNMNKMLGGNIVINTTSPPVTLIMNEFFCGDATTQTNITASTTTNAIVTFTDNFEKIAKFVKINGITFTRPQQLLLITNQPKKTRNIGIRYNNDLPNGISKNDPSVQNQMAYSVPKYLMGDPTMIKSI